jgi:hypothetical protein
MRYIARPRSLRASAVCVWRQDSRAWLTCLFKIVHDLLSLLSWFLRPKVVGFQPMCGQAFENVDDALEMHVAEVADKLCTLLCFQINVKIEPGPSVHPFPTFLKLFVRGSISFVSSIILPTFDFCVVGFRIIVYVTKTGLAEESIDRFVKLIMPVLVKTGDDANRHKLRGPTRSRL